MGLTPWDRPQGRPSWQPEDRKEPRTPAKKQQSTAPDMSKGGMPETVWSSLPMQWKSPETVAKDAMDAATRALSPAPPQTFKALDLATEAVQNAQRSLQPQPSQAELDWMNANNWEVVDLEATQAERNKYRLKNVRDLKPYSYLPSDAQIKELQRLYQTEQPKEGEEKVAPSGALEVDDMQVGRMTWEEYDALTDEQRMAVEFNTQLFRARRKDLKQRIDPYEARAMKDEYEQKVEEMFGADGGSSIFAPNVVKLLDEVDFKAVGQDLDQFLSMERAIDADELAQFTMKRMPIEQGEVVEKHTAGQNASLVPRGVVPVPGGGVLPAPRTDSEITPEETYLEYTNYDSIMTPANQRAIDAAMVSGFDQALREKMRTASLVKWDVASTWQGINPASFEGRPKKLDEIPFGFTLVNDAFNGQTRSLRQDKNDQEWDAWLWMVKRELENPEASDFSVELEMDHYDFDAADRAKFYNWINEQTMKEIQFGYPDQGRRRSPEEIRKIVGLEGPADGKEE
jgi:hypothetical protein